MNNSRAGGDSVNHPVPHWASLLVLIVLAAISSPRFESVAAEALLLRGAVVHTVSGDTWRPGEVLIKSGLIAGVGSKLDETGARVLDLAGLHLYPGLIAATSSLGLTEIGAVRATQDTSEVGEFKPEVQSWIAVNPDSELLLVARANGITHALTVPMGGLVSGQSGLMALDGWTTEQMTIKRSVALHLFWPSHQLNATPRDQAPDKAKWKSLDDQSKDRQKKIRELEEFFADAQAYAKARQAEEKLKSGLLSPIPAWEAMIPFGQGKIPVMIHADEVRQIKAAVQWATSSGHPMILAGGRDAWMVANLLAEKRIPVIYESTFELPERDTESYDIYFKAPALLHKAGVRVIFSEGLGATPAAQVRNLPYAAAQAVAFGLPADEALKGITLYPAQVLQADDRLGSITVGKDAALFAADGDILDIRTTVKRLWIGGREISLETRHTRLYEKYRQRPKAVAK